MWLRKTDVICVTGGATGLGAELVNQFALRDCSVAVIDVRPPHPADKNPKALYFQADISNAQEVQNCIEQIANQLGTVTVLVSNAGVRKPWTPIVNSTLEDMHSVLEVNLFGTLVAVNLMLQNMVKRERGMIVLVSSALSMQSPAGLAAYGASKAGVLGVYESLTHEFPKSSGIRTLLVCPGQLDTEMFGDVQTPSRIMAPVVSRQKLAGQIVSSVAQGQQGTLFAPYYVHLLPYLRTMPTVVTQALRWVSGMDTVHPNQLVQSYNNP